MVEILTLNNIEKWRNYLSNLPLELQDIYYKPEYYEIYETNGYGRAMCFVFTLNNKIAMYPFLINSVNNLGYKLEEEYYDIQGAYGYNGILSNSYDDEFVVKFNMNFLNFISQKKIIAEFTRFNPVLRNRLKPFHLDTMFIQENVVLDLSNDNIAKTEYEYSTRKNIKKALRNNLRSIIIDGDKINNESLSLFIEIYYDTMSRNNAANDYYFSLEYFNKLITSIGSNCRFYFVQFENKIISTELVLFEKKIAYSYLGGTLKDYFYVRPNDFLKDKIIKDMKCEGKKYYCLGGGSPGILRYKKSFAKNGSVKFFIGKRIYNQTIYKEIIQQWKKSNPVSFQTYNNMILKYRIKDA